MKNEQEVEQDYRVISITVDPNKYICTDKNDINNFINKTGMSLYHIHSIERLSDGEIFTIGDECKYYYYDHSKNKIIKECKIDKIYFIEKNRISIYVGSGLNIGLESLNKSKNRFEDLSEKILKYLNDNHHPHCILVADNTNVSVFEGLKSTGCVYKFLKD